MKISRWIYFPLIFMALYILQGLIMRGSTTVSEILSTAIISAVSAFIILFWSGAKARAISGRDEEEIYKVKQKRVITLLVNYEKAFELCKESAAVLHRPKVKNEDLNSGIITVKTGLKWTSFGQMILFKVKRININLTEVEIFTRPIPRTVLVSNGESWKYVEEISNFLKEKDAEINQKVLVESAAILNDIYVKPLK